MAIKTFVFKSHRYLAPFLALPVIFWALSGMMHPFMANWFRPDIARTFLPPQQIETSADASAFQKVLEDNAIENIEDLHLKKINDQWYYQFVNKDGDNRYISVTTGEVLPAYYETDHVKALAVRYTEFDSDAISEIERVTKFNWNYGSINRLLPVYRVRFQEPKNFDVYIDPVTDKLGSFTTPWKRFHQTFFAIAHNWGFLGNESNLIRVTLVFIFISLTAWVGVSGLSAYILFPSKLKSGRKRKMKFSRSLHRGVGIITSLFFILLSLSGAAHIFKKYTFDWGFLEAKHANLLREELRVSPLEAIQKTNLPVHQIALARVNGKGHYRLGILDRENPGKAIYVCSETGQTLDNGDIQYAKELALHFTQAAPESIIKTEPITRFRSDYSFIFKRLPVQRVTLKDEKYLSVTVDTAYSHLSVRTQPSDIVETILFLNLHKFHFMDPISKEARDWLSVIAASLMILTTVLGILLWFSKKRSKKRR